ncbi:MAG: hypothetical protein V1649_04965 [Patescibacteria group bacterium]
MDVAWELQISIRQVRRLLAMFRANKKKASTFAPIARNITLNELEQKVVNEMVVLKKEKPVRSNQFIAECLEDKFLRKISRSTVRRILIKNNCYEKTKYYSYLSSEY